MAKAKKETTTTKATAEKETAVKAEPAVEVKAVKEETKAAKTETKAVKPAKTETAAEAKKTTSKAAKETIKCTIQYQSKDTTIEEIVNSIKENYKSEGGKAAVKTLDVYIQPENNVAYYVVNGTVEGKVNY